MEHVVERSRSLEDLLSGASLDELNQLADLITDNGNGRISLSADIKQTIMHHRERGSLHSIADILKREICTFGGNTFANVKRSTGIEYAQIVRDVALELGVEKAAVASEDTADLERRVVEKIIAKLNDTEKANLLSEAGLDPPRGVSATTMWSMLSSAGRISEETISKVAPIVAKNLVSVAGATMSASASAIGTGILGRLGGALATGPAAIVAGVGVAAVTAYQASGPAFRITTPTVVIVGRIRQRLMQTEIEAFTQELEACL